MSDPRQPRRISNLVADFWHKISDIAMKQHRDVYPDGELDGYADNAQRGLFARQSNRIGIKNYTDHFRSGALPTGFSWISDGTFNGAPADLDYNAVGSYMIARASSTPHFLADAITSYAGYSFYARMRTGWQTEFGVRADDGTDNNYAELICDSDGAGGYHVDFRYRAGGGAVTDVQGPYYPASEFCVVRLYHYAATPAFRGYLVAENAFDLWVSNWDTGAIAWTPSRVGFKLQVNGGNQAAADWFYNEFS